MNAINHPTHYNTSVSTPSRPALQAFGFTPNELDNVECIAAMEDVFGPVALYWFCVLNGVKYLWRAGQKGELRQDYQKARRYFEHAQQLKGVGEFEPDERRLKSAMRLLP